MAKTNVAGKIDRGVSPEQPFPESGPSDELPAELKLLGQYIKDLSLESPHAANLMGSLGKDPQLQAEIDVNVTAQSAGTYEVALNVAIDAKSEVGIIYRVELVYAGLFRLSNVPQDLLHPVLLANGPRMLFPTLRPRAFGHNAGRRISTSNA